MNLGYKNILDLHNIIHRLTSLLLVFILALSAVGCGLNEADTAEQGTPYIIYYITNDMDGLTSVTNYVNQSDPDDVSSVVRILAQSLTAAYDSARMRAPLGADSGYRSVDIKDNQVTVDFGTEINGLDNVTRTLILAAAVRTLTQADGIDSVSFTVDGAPMTDAGGLAYGSLNADSFVDNTGLQINAEERTALTLYFTNETGDRLVRVNRSVVYSGNISMDKLVVMQLLEGPHENEAAFPVMNPATKVINVTTQDGTCYVNLDSSFLSPIDNITNDVAIYAIVDSLIEIGTVNKVQFLIDSDSDVILRESVSLNTLFERNLDIVEE